jgi:hypothetical protein
LKSVEHAVFKDLRNKKFFAEMDESYLEPERK